MIHTKNLPDFLIVGPHRTGSTWLFRNLNNHYDIRIPIEKELHFFCHHPHHPWSIPSDLRKKNLKAYRRRFAIPLSTHLRRTLTALGKRFQLPNRLLQGEATACYASLPRPMIQEILTLMPHVKIILMLREPIDRAWSHTVFSMRWRHRNGVESDQAITRLFHTEPTSTGSIQRWKEFIYSDPHILAGSRYSSIMKNWHDHLPEKNVLTIDFDELREPEQLLASTFKFLGAGFHRNNIDREVLHQRFTSESETPRMPPEIRSLLERELSNEMQWWAAYQAKRLQSNVSRKAVGEGML